MQTWNIEPENKEALERVLQFDDYINNFSDGTAYQWPANTDADDDPEQLPVQELDDRLEHWGKRPDIMELLTMDVTKDLDPADDRFELIVEVRATFIAFLKKLLFNASGSVNLEGAYRIFEFQHLFKPLFSMNQYGLRRLFGASIKKMMEWIYAGKSEFLLFFMDWFPDMITPQHHLKVLHHGVEPLGFATFDRRIQSACSKNETIAELYEKHKDKLREVYCNV